MRSGGDGGYSGPPSITISRDMVVRGKLDTPRGPAKFESMARDVAADAAHSVQAQRDEQNFAESTTVKDVSGVSW